MRASAVSSAWVDLSIVVISPTRRFRQPHDTPGVDRFQRAIKTNHRDPQPASIAQALWDVSARRLPAVQPREALIGSGEQPFDVLLECPAARVPQFLLGRPGAGVSDPWRFGAPFAHEVERWRLVAQAAGAIDVDRGGEARVATRSKRCLRASHG